MKCRIVIIALLGLAILQGCSHNKATTKPAQKSCTKQCPKEKSKKFETIPEKPARFD